MPRNDQPFVTILYNTDEFTDPIYGDTYHDDGLPTFISPKTGLSYLKHRFYNGQAGGYISYNISLTQIFLTSLLLSTSNNPSAVNAPTTLTATVVPQGGPTPTGTVTFTDLTTNIVLGTANVIANQAALITSFRMMGTHFIQAVYNGDANFFTSTAQLTQTIVLNLTTLALVSTQNPIPVGQTVTLTATITPTGVGTPTGIITFTDLTTSTVLGTPTVVANQGQVITSALTAAAHVVQAVYSGDTVFASSTVQLTQYVMGPEIPTGAVYFGNPSVNIISFDWRSIGSPRP